MTLAARIESTRVLEPGVRIGKKLEVLRRLGEGGMGTLWVARNLATDAEVAIKVLRPQREEDVDTHAAERFRHEARLGAMLAHRNITRVFDLLEDDDGSLVLVMELLHGETLQAQFEAKGALSSRDAVAIMVPVLGALQHAHDHGVVHRDLKPSNIFLHVDPDGHPTPKLLDFGIAKMQDSSVKTRAGNVLGTPSYMSPEQVRASTQIDGRSDLFSVGSVLYELITGENPFRTDSPSATLARVLEDDVDPDPRIEPRLWLVIQRALSKQPYERQASAAVLADALCEAIGEGAPRSLRQKPSARTSEPSIEVRRASSRPPVKEPTDRTEMDVPVGVPKPLPHRKLTVYGAAVLLALAGAVFVIAALRSTKTDSPTSTATAPGDSTTSATAPDQLPSTSMELPDDTPTGRSSVPEVRRGGRPGAPNRTPRRPAGTQPGPAAAPKTTASAPPIARTPGF